MRNLSLRQASRCETAKTPHCKCRCGGALHGARRQLAEQGYTPPDFFETLPEDDPHHVDSAEAKKQKRKAKRAQPVKPQIPLPLESL